MKVLCKQLLYNFYITGVYDSSGYTLLFIQWKSDVMWYKGSIYNPDHTLGPTFLLVDGEGVAAGTASSVAIKSTAIFIHETTLSHMDLIAAEGWLSSPKSTSSPESQDYTVYTWQDMNTAHAKQCPALLCLFPGLRTAFHRLHHKKSRWARKLGRELGIRLA